MSLATPRFGPDVVQRIVDEYRRQTPRSREQWERMRRISPASFLSVPGILPYPTFLDRVDGAYLYDADGRVLLDFFGAHSGALLGHNNPAIREAVRDELERGLVFGLARSPLELEVAEALVERVPSLEKIRFSPTGSEATMRALRLARAVTGRNRIAKTDFGYHGNHDLVWYGPDVTHAQHPGTRDLAPGISASVKDEVVLLPFNDPDGTTELVTAEAGSLAAIIVEPILGGTWLPATIEYLRTLRELSDRHGIVLIFDEMITLGVARGGAQELFGVTPDLTTGGKTVGHGMPLTFYGGRADVMDATGRGPDGGVPVVMHGGTYQRHNLALAAAGAALRQQDTALFERIQQRGDQLRGALRQLAADRGWPLQVTGVSHLWSLHWSGEPVTTDPRSVSWSNQRMRVLLGAMLLTLGVHHAGGIVTDAHTDDDVRFLVQRTERALDELLSSRLVDAAAD